MKSEDIIKNWKNINLNNYIKRNPKQKINESDLNNLELWIKSDNAIRHRKRMYRLSVPDALRLSKSWYSKQMVYFATKQEDKGSSLIRTYTTGFHWVKLNTDDSFSYESAHMKHCVYNYRKRTDCFYFSLRNPNKYPICTVEISRQGTVEQFKGKMNTTIDEFYNNYLIDFLVKNPIVKIKKTCHEILDLGYCYSQGQAYLLDELPLEVKIIHDFKLYNKDIKKIDCKKITIWGNLDLNELNKLEELPDHLVIYGNMNIQNCSKLKKLPKILQVSGTISIDSCPQIKEFPSFMKCKRLQLTNCGFLNWKTIKNIRIDSHISCFESHLCSTFKNKFKMVNDTTTWQTYEMKFVDSLFEFIKYYLNSSKKIFDLFSTR